MEPTRPPTDPPSEASRRAFLGALLGPKPRPDAVIRVAVNQPPAEGEGRGRWREIAAVDIDAAARHLAIHAEDAETYAALAWSVGGKGAEHVITRRWLSVDVDDKAMPGTSAEERRRQARILAGTIPGPAIVVDSGHGVHVHVLLPKGERLEDREDGRRHVAILGRALRLFLEQQALDLFGQAVSLDHCHGPERVWRVPGGQNCKTGEGAKTLTADRAAWRSVTLRHPGRVEGLANIAPSDLMFLLPHVAAAAEEHGAGDAGRNGQATPPRDAEPSHPRFDIRMLPPRLQSRWPVTDMNPSKADYAVAVELAKGGQPREVAEEAIRARRQAVGDPGAKGERADYVARTAKRAYKQVEDDRASAATRVSASRPPPPPREPFPLHVLPAALRRYVQECATCLGCCVSMVALPLIVVLGSAIGTTRRLRLRGGSRPWTEPPIFWCAVVAESGWLKSPALDQALDLIHRHEAEAARENEEARRRHEEALERYQHELTLYRRRKVGGDPPPRPERPAFRRYVVSDITIEALGDRLSDNPRGLLMARDELSAWLKSFDAYRTGGRGGDAAKWLEFHKARPLSVDRKTGDRSTLYVPRAAVSVLGGIQPGTLARALTPEFFDNGLAARLLVTMPTRARRRWNDAEVSAEALSGIERALERLLALQPVAGGDGKPIELVLTPSGKAAWIRFFNEHAEEGECLDGSLAAAWSKGESYAARFALLVSLVREATDDPTHGDGVDEDDVRAGVELARWFLAEADRVYGVLAESPADRARRRLADWIRAQGGAVSVRDLTRGPRAYRGNDAGAEQALHDLVTAGWGAWESAAPSARGGRPTRRFVLRDAPDATGETNATEREDPEVVAEEPGEAAETHEYDFQGQRRERGPL